MGIALSIASIAFFPAVKSVYREDVRVLESLVNVQAAQLAADDAVFDCLEASRG
ncbi:hypothetical protein ACL1G5_10260 [Corynebacterium striatum]